MSRIILLKSRIAYAGGLEKYTLRIASAFALRGHEVILLTTGRTVETVPGVRILSLGESRFSSYGAISFFHRKVSQWLKNNSHDIVFGLDRNPFQTHYRAGNGSHRSFLRRLSDRRLSLLLRQLNPKHRLILDLEKQAFENPSLRLLFTNSEMVREDLLRDYSIDPLKIQVVHNGVDFTAYNASSVKRENASFPVYASREAHRFLFVGHDFKRKGLPLLLRALRRLPEETFRLIVVGSDPHVATYRHWVRKNDLQNNIAFFTEHKDPLPFYREADTLVLPTLYDPFANVTLEALATGLFVITSPHNGAKEILLPETGTVTDPANTDAFTEVLRARTKMIPLLSEKKNISESVFHLSLEKQTDKIADATLNHVSI